MSLHSDLKSFIANHPTPTLVFDAASGKFITANSSARKLFSENFEGKIANEIFQVEEAVLKRKSFTFSIQGEEYVVHHEQLMMNDIFYLQSNPKTDLAEFSVPFDKIVSATFNEVILIEDRSLMVDYANPAALRNLGYSSEQLKSLRLTDLFNYPDEMALNALLNTLRKEETDRVQLQLKLQRQNGSHYDAEVVIQVLERDRLFLANITDTSSKLVTEKKLIDTILEKDTLIKEIHHRVKNNLQLISSILYLKLVTMGDSEIRLFLEDTRQKIRSIALIHERLLQSKSLDKVEISDYLGKLIHDLGVTYFKPDLQLEMETDIQKNILGLDTAIICGLIVNELITNSLKHAFKGRNQGRINITFTHTDLNQFCLKVGDDGVSLPEDIEPGPSASFGMQLIDVFVKQLGGTFSISRENGTRFEIIFNAG